MIKNNKQQLLLIMEEAINAAKPFNNFPKLVKKPKGKKDGKVMSKRKSSSKKKV